VINLEDEREVAEFAARTVCMRRFGAILADSGELSYTKDSAGWFDLSLISRFGRDRADQLKLANRRSYQDLLFAGLGLEFRGERYALPSPEPTTLFGDVAIASESGPVWPMKHWAHYEELRSALQAAGLVVNYLPRRATLLQHLGDIANHRLVISGDSLPMHLAVGLGIPCVAIFNCTSPWEIYDYGLLTKIVSPRLEEFFYKRDSDPVAMSVVRHDDVLKAAIRALERSDV
jgi:heptosyltransferase-2